MQPDLYCKLPGVDFCVTQGGIFFLLVWWTLKYNYSKKARDLTRSSEMPRRILFVAKLFNNEKEEEAEHKSGKEFCRKICFEP